MTILKVVYVEIDFQQCLEMATDLEVCMGDMLGRAWPSVQKIEFFCKWQNLLMKRESNWNVIEGSSVEGEKDLDWNVFAGTSVGGYRSGFDDE